MILRLRVQATFSSAVRLEPPEFSCARARTPTASKPAISTADKRLSKARFFMPPGGWTLQWPSFAEERGYLNRAGAGVSTRFAPGCVNTPGCRWGSYPISSWGFSDYKVTTVFEKPFGSGASQRVFYRLGTFLPPPVKPHTGMSPACLFSNDEHTRSTARRPETFSLNPVSHAPTMSSRTGFTPPAMPLQR